MALIVPSVTDLLADPTRVGELSPEAARALVPQLMALATRVLLRAIEPAPAPMPQSRQLLTAEDVAERLAIAGRKDAPAVSYVYELAKSGKLQAVRVGKYVRFDPADVDAFIDQHKRASRDVYGEGVDTRHSAVLSVRRGRGGGSAATEAAGAQANRARGTRGRASGHGQSLGA